MNKIIFATLAFTSLLSSCGPKSSENKKSTFKTKIVLNAFSDEVTSSTLDLSLLKDLPRSVDLLADMTPAKNQSDRGTCSVFTALSLIEGTIKKDMSMEVNLSEEYLNYAAKKNIGIFQNVEGSNMQINLQAIKYYGLLLERDLGYQPSWFAKGLPCAKYNSSNTNAPAECFSHSQPDQSVMDKLISSDGLRFGSIDKNTNEIIKFIATYKRPLSLSVTVNFNGWPDTGDVFYNEKLRRECLAAPADCGGHAVILTGYDLDKRVFFFKNSWGKEWGNNGFGTMTFETVDRYVSDSLYYATVKSPLPIPHDFAETPPPSIKDFSVTSKIKEDKSLDIQVSGKLEGIKGQLIYVSSFLSEKSKELQADADNSNVTILQLNDQEASLAGERSVRAISYHYTDKNNDISWTTDKALTISLNPKVMQLPSVIEAINSEVNDALLRTTVYVHTDDSYQVLKRVFHKIK